MIASIIARFGLHLAIAAGVLVTYFAWAKRIEVKAVEKERASVIEQGTKVNEKARSARRDAERAPHDSVRIWLRD
jgi:hypothetical protein